MAAGIQQLELERRVTRAEFDGFLQGVLARLMLSAVETSETRQMQSFGIRFGAVGMHGGSETLELSTHVAAADDDARTHSGQEAEAFKMAAAGGAVGRVGAAARRRGGRALAVGGDARRQAGWCCRC